MDIGATARLIIWLLRRLYIWLLRRLFLSPTVPLHHGDNWKCPGLPHFRHSALRAGHASRADEWLTYPQHGHLFLGSFNVGPRDGWCDLNGLPLEKCLWLVTWLTSGATCVLTSSRMRAISTVFDSVNVDSCSSCNFKDSSLSDMPAIILSRIFSSYFPQSHRMQQVHANI